MALASALLFGASTPLAKLLLGDGVDPWLLAGLLYPGSGVGLRATRFVRGALGVPAAEAPLRRGDLPWFSWNTTQAIPIVAIPSTLIDCLRPSQGGFTFRKKASTLKVLFWD
jgi:hypothetical protein